MQNEFNWTLSLNFVICTVQSKNMFRIVDLLFFVVNWVPRKTWMNEINGNEQLYVRCCKMSESQGDNDVYLEEETK